MKNHRDEKIDVSVVIPCYNCAATIERAIESVINQTILPYEIIVVNDKSSDAIVKKLKELQIKYIDTCIHIISLEENAGPSMARNTGWNQASSTYLAFLDADDIWHPEKLKIQYDVMLKNKTIIISGHDCEKDTNREYSPVNNHFHIVKKREILLSNIFRTASTIMVRSNCKIRFPREKRYAEEYTFMLNIIFNPVMVKHKNYAIKIESILAYQFKDAYGISGLSANVWLMEKGELQAYNDLYQKKSISLMTLTCISVYSLLKYARRLFIIKYRSIKGFN